MDIYVFREKMLQLTKTAKHGIIAVEIFLITGSFKMRQDKFCSVLPEIYPPDRKGITYMIIKKTASAFLSCILACAFAGTAASARRSSSSNRTEICIRATST